MIITDADTLDRALRFLETVDTVAYDIETTGLNPRKDRIIGIGFGTDIAGFYCPANQYAKALLEVLKTKKLLMHNGSFDCRFTKKFYDIDLTPALHCDTMLLKHTCDEDFPFGLKEIAAKLWGHDVTKEKEEMVASIKANGGTAKQFYLADVDLLAKYCIQDCALTFRLYRHYSQDLQRQGLEAFFYNDEVMPVLREVVIPMESQGIHLDMDKLYETQNEMASAIANLEASLLEAISPQISLFMDWILAEHYAPTTEKGNLKKWAKEGLSPLQAFERDNPGQSIFNLNSKTHLKFLFFNIHKEKPLSTTDKGSPQVDEEFLTSVAPKYPWVQMLLDLNKLNKLKSTYVDRLLEEQENGIFYPSFHMHRTVSGRFGSDIQQLPRTLEPGQASDVVLTFNNRVRSFLRPAPGFRLCSADYEQLEPSIFAHTSGDPALQAIFKSGVDFYSEIAIRTEGLEGSSDKKAPNYIGKINKAARQKAKAYALGIAYGMSGYKLKFEIGCTDYEADKLVRDYLTAFPNLAEWMEDSQRSAYLEGRVKTQAGRVRHLSAAQELWRKYGPPITHDLELWKAYKDSPDLYKKAKADRKVFKNELNNAINFQVQGLAASVVNRAALAINRILGAHKLKTRLLFQVHDELVYEIPENELQSVPTMIKLTMESIMPLSVPLRTEPQIGNNYKECK